MRPATVGSWIRERAIGPRTRLHRAVGGELAEAAPPARTVQPAGGVLANAAREQCLGALAADRGMSHKASGERGWDPVKTPGHEAFARCGFGASRVGGFLRFAGVAEHAANAAEPGSLPSGARERAASRPRASTSATAAPQEEIGRHSPTSSAQGRRRGGSGSAASRLCSLPGVVAARVQRPLPCDGTPPASRPSPCRRRHPPSSRALVHGACAQGGPRANRRVSSAPIVAGRSHRQLAERTSAADAAVVIAPSARGQHHDRAGSVSLCKPASIGSASVDSREL